MDMSNVYFCTYPARQPGIVLILILLLIILVNAEFYGTCYRFERLNFNLFRDQCDENGFGAK